MGVRRRGLRGAVVGLGEGGVGAGGEGGGEVGGELGGEDCGAGGGDEVFGVEGGEEGVFEAWMDGTILVYGLSPMFWGLDGGLVEGLDGDCDGGLDGDLEGGYTSYFAAVAEDHERFP